MTSGIFRSVAVDAVTIPELRQRKEFDIGELDALADSIRRLGLIHPLLVDENLQLIAGERRLMAIKTLGWDTVPVQFANEITEKERYALELEENVKRTDITWQEKCSAILNFHEDRVGEVQGWTHEDTAAALGFTQSMITKELSVAQQLRAGNQAVVQAPKLSTAIGLVTRAAERQKATEATQILSTIYDKPGSTLESVKAFAPVTVANFNEWVLTYEGPRFNLLHCDFPYGINADQMQQGYSVGEHGGYSDRPEDFFALLSTLCENIDRVAAESCHIMFWFSMKFYGETLFMLRRAGFVVDEFPLIWQKDVGLLPDPDRGPRRVYETALFGRRGDRKIVRAVSNAVTLPRGQGHIHMSVKPVPVLEHFFRMLVDDSTILLDPTAGGGTALQAALGLGARSAIGLEINPEFAARANEALQRQRAEMLKKENANEIKL